MTLKSFKARMLAILPVLMILAAASALSSCNSKEDDPEPPTGAKYIDIVTVVSTDADGSVFTFQPQADEPTVTLTTSQTFKTENVKAGDRIAIAYYYPGGEKRYTSGKVRVVTYYSCFGPTVTVAPDSSDSNWSSRGMFVSSLWRAGTWLNLEAVVTAQSVEGMSMKLILDPATEGTDTPELHLVYAEPFSGGMERTVFGSYDIASIWNNPATKQVKVFFFTGSSEDSFYIIKSEMNITPAN